MHSKISILIVNLFALFALATAASSSTAGKTRTSIVTETETAEHIEYKTVTTTKYSTKTVPYVETPTSVPSVQEADKSFQQRALDVHNNLRALHGAQPLSWSDELYTSAQSFANNEFVCNGTLNHSAEFFDNKVGENLALGYDDIEQAVNAFYHTSKHYYYNPDQQELNATHAKYSHFTQLVWNSTHSLGCGFVDCGSYYRKFFICQYSEVGNVPGEFNNNVFEPVVFSS